MRGGSINWEGHCSEGRWALIGKDIAVRGVGIGCEDYCSG